MYNYLYEKKFTIIHLKNSLATNHFPQSFKIQSLII